MHRILLNKTKDNKMKQPEKKKVAPLSRSKVKDIMPMGLRAYERANKRYKRSDYGAFMAFMQNWDPSHQDWVK